MRRSIKPLKVALKAASRHVLLFRALFGPTCHC